MIKYFKRAFKITNENIILATPLVLFLFFLSIYLDVSRNAPVTIGSKLLLLTTVVFMLSAFFAGWFYMLKKAVDLDKQEFIIDEDRAKASLALIKEIPVGIGEYFLSFVGAMFLYTIVLSLVLIVGYHIGVHFIGKVGIPFEQFRTAIGSSIAMKALISSLSKEQLIRMNSWSLLFLSTMTVFYFLTMFWGAHIVMKNRNPFLALFQSLAFTFKNFFSAVILFVYISLVNFTVSTINAISTLNPVTYFLSMLIYFYFLVYIVVLVFLYYDRENSNGIEQKSQDKNNSASGTDGDGQEQTGDSDSSGE